MCLETSKRKDFVQQLTSYVTDQRTKTDKMTILLSLTVKMTSSRSRNLSSYISKSESFPESGPKLVFLRRNGFCLFVCLFFVDNFIHQETTHCTHIQISFKRCPIHFWWGGGEGAGCQHEDIVTTVFEDIKLIQKGTFKGARKQKKLDEFLLLACSGKTQTCKE